MKLEQRYYEKMLIMVYGILCIFLIYIMFEQNYSSFVLVSFLLINNILIIMRFVIRRKFGYIFIVLINSCFLLYFSLYVTNITLYFAPLFIYEIMHRFWKHPNFFFIGSAFVCGFTFLTSERVSFYVANALIFCIVLTFEIMLKKQLSLEKENNVFRKRIISIEMRLKQEELYQQQLIHTLKLEERTKLSQQVHDQVGHSIAGSIFQLEGARTVVDKNPMQAKQMIENTIIVLRKGMDEIRGTLRILRPAEETLGVNQLKSQLQEVLKETSCSFEITHLGELHRLTNTHWRLLQSVMREATTNSLKYSKADVLYVNINVLNKLIRFEIRDNGVGCSQYKKGIGLKGMEQRAAEIGGTMIFDGSNGFSVVLLCPIVEG